ncbi:hypothetical protein [Nonomuraea endophytica]|uniref:hypothetical protein n=1 Tax=Nonomuraea endophytica TaxID=714136 RepID=UPI0037C64448
MRFIWREVLAAHTEAVGGVSFFANDTFGHFVPGPELALTLDAVRKVEETHVPE